MSPVRIALPLLVFILVASSCSGTDGDDGGDGDGATSATTASNGAQTASCADEPPASPDADAVAAIVDQAVEEQGLRAVLYRVTRASEVVASGAVGESRPGEPATTEMHVGVGNVAFAYMGTLLLLLDEDGTVSLDDPVGKWLPDLDLPAADAVTLEMLVRNTSGYADHVRDDDFVDQYLADPFQSFTPEELIEIGMSEPPWYAPGTAWSYSHTGYVILGLALEAAAEKDLDALLLDRVIEPMGLEATTPIESPLVPDPALHSYTNERDVFEDSTSWNLSWSTPPGAVVASTICDMADSARAIGTGELLAEESFEAMTALDPVEREAPPEGCPPTTCRQFPEGQHYGLGVIVNGGWIQQGPAFSGFSGIHAYLPDDDLAVAIATVDGLDAEPGGNKATGIWTSIAEELAPEHVPVGG